VKTFKVTLYNKKGHRVLQHKVQAKTHKLALTSIKTIAKWVHACVVGDTVKRYNKNLKLITVAPKYFKTFVGSTPSILIMFNTYPEFHSYEDIKERDMVYEEICIKFPSAVFAKTSPAQTDTTVSSEETSGSNGGLTEQKILSGFAENATTQDAPTPSNTVKSSGKSKYVVSENHEWKSGYKNVPSKSNTSTSYDFLGIFIGEKERKHGGLSFMTGMKPLVGKVLPFKLYGDDKYVMVNNPTYIVEKEWVQKVDYSSLPQTSLSSEAIDKMHESLNKSAKRHFKFVGKEKLVNGKFNGVIDWNVSS
jgi:hypothetical protein